MALSRNTPIITSTILVMLLAASCGPGSSGGGGDSGEVDLDATVAINHTTMPTTLDPHAINANASGSNWLYDTLILEDSDRNLLPGIATEWNVSEDGLNLDLTIREGIAFNDGTPVDADSVRISLDRARTLEGSSSVGLLSAIESVETADPTTVTIRLSRPDSSLLAKLSSPAGSVVSPRAIAAGVDLTTADHDAGSTPYRLADYSPAERIAVERRPDPQEYWDPEAWRIKRLEASTAANNNTLIAGLKTKAITATRLAQTSDQISSTIAGSNLKLTQLLTDSVDAIWINPAAQTPELRDPAIRRAISQTIDRKTLAASGALSQDCEPATQLYGPDDPAHLDDDSLLAYDPDAARATLEKTGGFTIEVQSSVENPALKAYGTYLQQELPKYGVKVKLVELPNTQGITNFASGKADFSVKGVPAYLDTGWALDTTYLTGLPANLKLPGVPANEVKGAKDLIDEANSLPIDTPEREAALKAAHRHVLDEAWNIPLCLLKLNYVYDEKLHGIDESLPQHYSQRLNARYWYMAK